MAKAAKAAGIEAPTDTRLDGDREALLAELRAQREQAARDAEAGEGGEGAAPVQHTAETLFKN